MKLKIWTVRHRRSYKEITRRCKSPTLIVNRTSIVNMTLFWERVNNSLIAPWKHQSHSSKKGKKPRVHKEVWEINNVTTYPFLQQTVQNVRNEGKKVADRLGGSYEPWGTVSWLLLISKIDKTMETDSQVF